MPDEITDTVTDSNVDISQLPESETNQSIDYTEWLNTISQNIGYLREQKELEVSSPESLEYEKQLQDIQVLLTSMNEKLLEAVETPASDNVYLKPLGEITKSLETVTTQLDKVNSYSQSMYDLQIVGICGIGILIGCICALILSGFFRG